MKKEFNLLCECGHTLKNHTCRKCRYSKYKDNCLIAGCSCKEFKNKEFKSLSDKIKEIEDELQKDSIRKQKSFLNPIDVLNELEEDIKEAVKRLMDNLAFHRGFIKEVFGDKLT